MTNARFYHAGCSVCVSVEETLLNPLKPDSQVKVEVVHLGDQPQRVAEAEQAGVKSVPSIGSRGPGAAFGTRRVH